MVCAQKAPGGAATPQTSHIYVSATYSDDDEGCINKDRKIKRILKKRSNKEEKNASDVDDGTREGGEKRGGDGGSDSGDGRTRNLEKGAEETSGRQCTVVSQVDVSPLIGSRVA